MRALSFVSAPAVMAATVFGAGWMLQGAGMLHARLTYDALGGPAAYVLYGVVVGLGLLHLLFDRAVDAARSLARSRRVGRHASRSARPSPRPVHAGPAPVPLPPLPPTTVHVRPARVSPPVVAPPFSARPAPVVRTVRAVRRPRAVAPPAAAASGQR